MPSINLTFSRIIFVDLDNWDLDPIPKNVFLWGLDSGHYTDRKKICIVSFLNSFTRAARFDLQPHLLSGKKAFSGTKESVKVRVLVTVEVVDIPDISSMPLAICLDTGLTVLRIPIYRHAFGIVLPDTGFTRISNQHLPITMHV